MATNPMFPAQSRQSPQRPVKKDNAKLPMSADAQTALLHYLENVVYPFSDIDAQRQRLLMQDRIYAREVDWTAKQREARRRNLAGDPHAVQNVTVPVVEPIVESGLTYLTELFLSGYPIFPVVADPARQEVATQLEAIIGESATQFQYTLHLTRTLRDGLKHNLMAVDTGWDRRVVGSKFPDPLKPANREDVLFEGFKTEHVSLYNAYFDRRVAPAEVSTRGDFAGYSKLMSAVELKKLMLKLPQGSTMNFTDALTSSCRVATGTQAADSYYIPELNLDDSLTASASNSLNRDWLQWVGVSNSKLKDYKETYEVLKLYVRMIPARFGMSGGMFPAIWEFYIVNRQHVIYAKELNPGDDAFPMIVAQPIDDGNSWQTKSMGASASVFQQLGSSLFNSGLASQRRKVYDRLFYDPSRIAKKDIDNTDPVARIAIRSEAYGTPISEAIWQAPYRDDGVAQVFGVGREVIEMGDIATGQNRVQRGQFQKGNKTRFEFQETMSNSNARPRLMALVLESAFFQPLKFKMRDSILQNQKSIQIQDPSTGQVTEVSPLALREEAWKFKLADGLLPAERLVNTEALGMAMQLAAAQPQFGMEYDLIGMSTYIMSVQGAKWISQFKRTPQQQQQIAAATQQPQGQNGQPQA